MKKILFGILLMLVLSGTDVSAYSDLQSGDNFSEAVNFYSDSGILKGYDDGTFRPDQDINRAEFLKQQSFRHRPLPENAAARHHGLRPNAPRGILAVAMFCVHVAEPPRCICLWCL